MSGGRGVPREEVYSLWKQSKVAGLFNIPWENEDLFNTCKDFCIEDQRYDEDLQDLQKKNKSLQELNMKLMQVKLIVSRCAIDLKLQTVKELREQVAQLAAESLSKEDDKVKQLELLKKSLESEKKKVAQLEQQKKKEEQRWEMQRQQIEHDKQNLQQELQKWKEVITVNST